MGRLVGEEYVDDIDEEQKMPFVDELRAKSDKGEASPDRLLILAEAAKATGGSRNSIYGEPRDNLGVQAKLIEAYLHGRIHAQGSEFRITSEDVAIINTLIKIGRIATGKYHRDNYVDGAAYMAIAGELGDTRIKQVFPEDDSNEY